MDKAEIVVLAARPEDLATAEEVGAKAFETLRDVYRPGRELRKGKSEMTPRLTRVVAWLDGGIVGTAEYRVEGERCRVLGLGVLPGFRGRGVARRILDHLAGVARRGGAGCMSVFFIRETGNAPFFEKLGFRTVEERPAEGFESDRFEVLREVRMEKYLS